MTYTHDKIGELTIADSSVTGGANDWAYAHDAYGRMSCARSAATTCAASTTTQTSVYDALDRTISITLNSATTSNTFRGTSDVLTRRVGTVTTAYAATAAGTPIAEKGTTTNPFFYLRDPHGDIVSSVSTAAANQTTRTFDPFGKPLSPTQVSGSQPVLGYQGDLTDPSTSLVDMGTRYYAPTTGRFTSRDVVAGDPTFPMSLNRFAYGLMNPITMFDPTGMAGCDIQNPDPHCGTTTENDGGTTTTSFPSGASTTTDSSGNVVGQTSANPYNPVPVPKPECHARSCAYVTDAPDYVNPFSVTQSQHADESCTGFLGFSCWDRVGELPSTLGRCVLSPDACVTNVEIFVTPIVSLGLAAVMAQGISAACGMGPVGCGVGIVFLGPAVVAGVGGAYLSAEEVWWGPDRDDIYQPLDG